MNRNSFNISHNFKADMDFSFIYPVYCKEVIPGDIAVIDTNVNIKALNPPTAPIQDKIKYHIHYFFVPDRLTDNHFVRNMTGTKSGEVHGNFKTLSPYQIRYHYGDMTLDKHGGNLRITDMSTTYNQTRETKPTYFDKKYKESHYDYDGINFGAGKYQFCYPVLIDKDEDTSDSGNCPHCRADWDNRSLADYLGLSLTENVGLNGLPFRTNAISAYYMIINFFYTNEEWQKYIAPFWDYDYGIYDGQKTVMAGTGLGETIHRYEVLEDETGNEFEEPHTSKRCWRGLVVHNWKADYFSKSTKDAQRGIAPQVPVALNMSNLTIPRLDIGRRGIDGALLEARTGTTPISAGATNEAELTIYNPTEQEITPPDAMGKLQTYTATAKPTGTGSFVIADLRTALALQHFKEDCQYSFKWSDFLMKMFGTAPEDNTLDMPLYLGGFSDFLTTSEVIQTVETESGSLGDMAGHMFGGGNGSTIKYNVKEHGLIIGLAYLMPEHNYENGVDRQYLRQNYLDMYFSQFNGIGAQATLTQEVATANINFTEKGGTTDDTPNKKKNFAFTDRYEEFKHGRNRVAGKCRTGNVEKRVWVKDSNAFAEGTGNILENLKELNPVSKYDFGRMSIKENHSVGMSFGEPTGTITMSEQFALCLPQLEDIFTDETESPFMMSLRFDEQFFRPIPVHCTAGIQYV